MYLINESSYGLSTWTGDERPTLSEAVKAAKEHNEFLDGLGVSGEGRTAWVETPEGLRATEANGWLPL